MKPTVPEVRPLVAALYRRHAAGCCLHIVLDDGNVGDEHVDFCIQWATDHNHPDCLSLAKLLRHMSRTQRKKLYEVAGEGMSG